MRETIIQRLKSPVVIAQLIVSVFAVATALTGKNYDNLVNQLTIIVTAAFALFSATNNPTTPDQF